MMNVGCFRIVSLATKTPNMATLSKFNERITILTDLEDNPLPQA
jgi:hypothetical protein